MALFVDLVALSNGLHGSVQMDSVALFSWIGWLRHHGILNFYILSIPNKANVYPEYMPDTVVREDSTSKTDLLMKYLSKNTDLNVVDAKPDLLKAKKKNQVYYKTDTHYNQRVRLLQYKP